MSKEVDSLSGWCRMDYLVLINGRLSYDLNFDRKLIDLECHRLFVCRNKIQIKVRMLPINHLNRTLKISWLHRNHLKIVTNKVYSDSRLLLYQITWRYWCDKETLFYGQSSHLHSRSHIERTIIHLHNSLNRHWDLKLLCWKRHVRCLTNHFILTHFYHHRVSRFSERTPQLFLKVDCQIDCESYVGLWVFIDHGWALYLQAGQV